MKLPLIVINFKTYDSALGEKAINIAKAAQEVTDTTGVLVAICPQITDLQTISQVVNIPTFSQHADSEEPGAHTGHITLEAVKNSGASGTLINHSEDRIPIEKIQTEISHAKELSMQTIVCAQTKEECIAITKLNPDFVAYEPPELIGGDISVTTKPEIIKEIVLAIRKINTEIGILIGAGVKKAEDVKAAIELQTNGVLLASGITKSDNPKQTLQELVSAISQ